MKAICLATSLFLIMFILGCQNNQNQTDHSETTTSIKHVAWDTLKIKAAVNDYLKTHEKYYSLIDSIHYSIDTFRTMWILSDQAGYFTSIANTLSLKNPQQYLIETPGQPISKLMLDPNPYYDSANLYDAMAYQIKEDTTMMGYRVVVNYRLSDVMLTYSDFTSYLFYLDTSYRVMPKSIFLHYTNFQTKPFTPADYYFDTIYVYTPPKN